MSKKKKGVNKSLRTPEPKGIEDWVEKGEVPEESESPKEFTLKFDPVDNPGTQGSEIVNFHVPYDVKDEIDRVVKIYRRKMEGMTFSRAQVMRVLLYAFVNSEDFQEEFFSSDEEADMVQTVLRKLKA